MSVTSSYLSSFGKSQKLVYLTTRFDLLYLLYLAAFKTPFFKI